MNLQPLTLSDCWAKTDPQGKPTVGVAEHCIAVGAAAEQIMALLAPSTKRLVPPGAATLIAAHDIGKISAGFQLKCRAWAEAWQEPLKLGAPDVYCPNHAQISQAVLSKLDTSLKLWIMAHGGHHGSYVSKNEKVFFGLKLPGIDAPFEDLQNELWLELQSMFGTLTQGQCEIVEKSARLHWFTGLMIFSDWLGSDRSWFPFQQADRSLPEYQALAKQAVAEAGFGKNQVFENLSFTEIFGLPEPRPLQEAILKTVNAPGLTIIEAAMGEGKTEAAILAAYLRWTQGGERGLYFALPTQLTSNRIHERVFKILERLVAEPSALALVHGAANLSDKRVMELSPAPEQETANNDQAAMQWFADNRRAMLAPFGVGTIDQALLSVLAARFSALRLFGLAGKVVVFDEVHSYDSYTSEILDRLVAWLLKLGSTVIVLSATLTNRRRASLVKAAGGAKIATPNGYPLITTVSSGHTMVTPVKGSEGNEKKVRLTMMTAGEEDWMTRACRSAEAGACVLVVRNTVLLARETFLRLRGMLHDTGVMTGLIHSRFTQADRGINENRWMDMLGQSGASRPSAGAILVGTQVLEQSVDIDSDLLFTDLAPIDLVLQRMGRLHRHQRGRPPGFDEARCIVLRPKVCWQKQASEITEALAPHHFIYPAYSLYTADLILSKCPAVDLPKQIRALLEASDAEYELPDGVRELREQLEKEIRAQLRTATQSGPFLTVPLEDVEGAQTRWKMKPSAMLVLLAKAPRIHSDGIELEFPDGSQHSVRPGYFDRALAKSLNSNAIKVPYYMVGDQLGAQPDWLKKYSSEMALATCAEGKVSTLEEGSMEFVYGQETGLGHYKRKTQPTEWEEESWY